MSPQAYHNFKSPGFKRLNNFKAQVTQLKLVISETQAQNAYEKKIEKVQAQITHIFKN